MCNLFNTRVVPVLRHEDSDLVASLLEIVDANFDPLRAEPWPPAKCDGVPYSHVGPVDDNGPLARLEKRLWEALDQVAGVCIRRRTFRRASILHTGKTNDKHSFAA